ncbi:hypothetical protein Leryth_005358 [Lithospermum erythrorhizon]|nr:hypothetical protein Leryth_005358 [Lithospermum erythrorhizon]
MKVNKGMVKLGIIFLSATPAYLPQEKSLFGSNFFDLYKLLLFFSGSVMQGQRSGNGPLPELSFFHSSSSDSSIDPQSCWNCMLNPSQGQPSDCVVSSTNGSTSYLNSALQEGHALSGWNLGESSSSGACDVTNQKNNLNDCARGALVLGERQYGLSDNLSLNSLNGDLHTVQDASGSFFMQSSVPSDLIANLELAGSNEDENNDDDCQVIECVNTFSFGSSNQQSPGPSSYPHHFTGMPSESGIYLAEGAVERPNSSSGGSRLSCKRKMRETCFGQSSGSGSSNHIQNVGSSLWQGTAIYPKAAYSRPVASGNNIGINCERSQPRLGLSIGETASEFPLSLGTPGNAERSHRNFRSRITTSRQQDAVPITFSCTQNAGGSSNLSSSQRSLRLPPISNSFDLNPFNVAEGGSLQGYSMRRDSQLRWSSASSSRADNPSSAVSSEGVSFQCDEPYLSSVPGVGSHHPMFIPASGSSSQNPGNWSLAAKSIGTSLGVASSSHGGVRSGFNSSAPPLIPHHHSLHPSRLPEYSQRSLITPPGAGTGNQNTHNLMHSGPYSTLPEITFPSMPSNQRRSNTRSSLLLGNTVGITHPSRGLAAASEGRSWLVSEIRNVLDRMRRGEALRVEDLMILDQSGFFGMADLHDRHRDMRL